MKMLEDKRVIVTGSTMGIGKAIAERAVKEGARVLVHGLERGQGEALVDQLGGNKATLHVDDLSDPAAADRVIQAALKAFGGIDALINNAGMVVTGRLETADAASFDQVMAVNARAPLLLTKAVYAYLKTSKGCVLNIGSVNAHCGEENLLPYSMSKGALMTMTRNLGDTLFREGGVRINQINPGWILTENEISRKREQGMDDDWPSKLSDQFAPAGRIIAPEEIAAAAVFWISDQVGPVTGTVFEMEQYPMIGRNPAKL
jgi:NAD(P)-dependent dehydrogenase (short-subunit alcohol dehydrogenase family)